MPPVDANPSASTPADPGPEGTAPLHPHNFDVQKEEHRRIRNDPDYDDWEYGTEPLPHEAWLSGRRRTPRAAAPGGTAAGGDAPTA